jgi:hypothetical protein
MPYDPDRGPDPVAWLAMADGDRLDAVREHHQKAKHSAERLEFHAAIHVAVETQLAEEHPATVSAFGRLLREGLDRHQAIHAIGCVLMEELSRVMREHRPHDAVAYARELETLTAASWRAKYSE